jgi:hypothetical protein
VVVGMLVCTFDADEAGEPAEKDIVTDREKDDGGPGNGSRIFPGKDPPPRFLHSAVCA